MTSNNQAKSFFADFSPNNLHVSFSQKSNNFFYRATTEVFRTEDAGFLGSS
jgi:hypothetical protein